MDGERYDDVKSVPSITTTDANAKAREIVNKFTGWTAFDKVCLIKQIEAALEMEYQRGWKEGVQDVTDR